LSLWPTDESNIYIFAVLKLDVCGNISAKDLKAQNSENIKANAKQLSTLYCIQSRLKS